MRQTTALDPRADQVQRIALIVGVVALVLAGVGALFSPAVFFQSYLVAFLFWLGFPLGCMALLALYHLGGGVWGLPIRRPLEAAMITIPLFALLGLPLIFGWSSLYPWARPEQVAADPILQHKSLYLNVPFTLGRYALYFVLWTAGALLLYRMSAEQDRTGDEDLPRLLGRRSRLALFFFVLAVSFSSFDWGMSLDPHWFSTIYGILFLIGDGLTAVAFSIVVLRLLAQRSPTRDVTTTQTFNDFGNLLLAFVVLWAYMNLSQFLIVYAGNLPEEVPWYLRRSQGGWQFITWFLVAVQFVGPFFVLLARMNKRNAQRLTWVAGVVLFMRLVDVFWMIIPEVRRDGLFISWLDIVAPIGVGGIWIAAYIWALRRLPLVPLHDHRLANLVDEHGHALAGAARHEA
jgi:hypothetical protein